MASWDEHVPEIECATRNIKERVRGTYNQLPFTWLPHEKVIDMVYHNVFWINAFPANDGIIDTLSTCTIVTGTKIQYNTHCRVEFGTYVQVHDEHDNTMVS